MRNPPGAPGDSSTKALACASPAKTRRTFGRPQSRSTRSGHSSAVTLVRSRTRRTPGRLALQHLREEVLGHAAVVVRQRRDQPLRRHALLQRSRGEPETDRPALRLRAQGPRDLRRHRHAHRGEQFAGLVRREAQLVAMRISESVPASRYRWRGSRGSARAHSTSRSRLAACRTSRSRPATMERSVMWSALSMTSTTGRAHDGDVRGQAGNQPGGRRLSPGPGRTPRTGARRYRTGPRRRSSRTWPDRRRTRPGSAIRSGRPVPWLCCHEAASTVLPEPAGPLSSVSGDRCTSRVNRASRRWRSTVACAWVGRRELRRQQRHALPSRAGRLARSPARELLRSTVWSCVAPKVQLRPAFVPISPMRPR